MSSPIIKENVADMKNLQQQVLKLVVTLRQRQQQTPVMLGKFWSCPRVLSKLLSIGSPNTIITSMALPNTKRLMHDGA
jgi:hypothetical protein